MLLYPVPQFQTHNCQSIRSFGTEPPNSLGSESKLRGLLDAEVMRTKEDVTESEWRLRLEILRGLATRNTVSD